MFQTRQFSRQLAPFLFFSTLRFPGGFEPAQPQQFFSRVAWSTCPRVEYKFPAMEKGSFFLAFHATILMLQLGYELLCISIFKHYALRCLRLYCTIDWSQRIEYPWWKRVACQRCYSYKVNLSIFCFKPSMYHVQDLSSLDLQTLCSRVGFGFALWFFHPGPGQNSGQGELLEGIWRGGSSVAFCFSAPYTVLSLPFLSLCNVQTY